MKREEVLKRFYLSAADAFVAVRCLDLVGTVGWRSFIVLHLYVSTHCYCAVTWLKSSEGKNEDERRPFYVFTICLSSYLRRR